eukprot:2879481-Ditylum_brightwellii.AAC.1
MALVERKEIVVKREDIDERIRLSVSEGATIESLRKALCINNSNGVDGRDVSGYRFDICGKEYFFKLYDEVIPKEDE